jgi:hypothetical protein
MTSFAIFWVSVLVKLLESSLARETLALPCNVFSHRLTDSVSDGMFTDEGLTPHTVRRATSAFQSVAEVRQVKGRI